MISRLFGPNLIVVVFAFSLLATPSADAQLIRINDNGMGGVDIRVPFVHVNTSPWHGTHVRAPFVNLNTPPGHYPPPSYYQPPYYAPAQPVNPTGPRRFFDNGARRAEVAPGPSTYRTRRAMSGEIIEPTPRRTKRPAVQPYVEVPIPSPAILSPGQAGAADRVPLGGSKADDQSTLKSVLDKTESNSQTRDNEPDIEELPPPRQKDDKQRR